MFIVLPSLASLFISLFWALVFFNRLFCISNSSIFFSEASFISVFSYSLTAKSLCFLESPSFISIYRLFSFIHSSSLRLLGITTSAKIWFTFSHIYKSIITYIPPKKMDKLDKYNQSIEHIFLLIKVLDMATNKGSTNPKDIITYNDFRDNKKFECLAPESKLSCFYPSELILSSTWILIS